MRYLEKSILERFKILFHERLRAHKLILFGSRARGDADPQSDLDVYGTLPSTASCVRGLPPSPVAASTPFGTSAGTLEPITGTGRPFRLELG